MTIDSLMIQPERYKTQLQEDVFREAFEQYNTMAIRKGLVRKEDLYGFVYSNIYNDIRDQMIYEAVERKDYEMFGMTKEDFLTKSYSGQIEDVSVNPYIKESEFLEAIELFIETYQLMTIDTSGYAEHCPLQEVW